MAQRGRSTSKRRAGPAKRGGGKRRLVDPTIDVFEDTKISFLTKFRALIGLFIISLVILGIMASSVILWSKPSMDGVFTSASLDEIWYIDQSGNIREGFAVGEHYCASINGAIWDEDEGCKSTFVIGYIEGEGFVTGANSICLEDMSTCLPAQFTSDGGLYVQKNDGVCLFLARNIALPRVVYGGDAASFEASIEGAYKTSWNTRVEPNSIPSWLGGHTRPDWCSIPVESGQIDAAKGAWVRIGDNNTLNHVAFGRLTMKNTTGQNFSVCSKPQYMDRTWSNLHKGCVLSGFDSQHIDVARKIYCDHIGCSQIIANAEAFVIVGISTCDVLVRPTSIESISNESSIEKRRNEIMENQEIKSACQ